MANKKILSILLLALLINPALHCMDETDDEIMSTTKYVLGGLAGVAVLSSILCARTIRRRKQELLRESQNIEVFTSEHSNELYGILKEERPKLCVYGIFKGSKHETLKKFHSELVEELLPRNFSFLFNKNQYDLIAGRARSIISSCMRNNKLDGIVALIAPPDGKEKRKIVVESSGPYCAYQIFDNSLEDIKNSKENIFHGTCKTISKGHIVLAVPGITELLMKSVLKQNRLLSTVILDKIKRLKHHKNDGNDASIKKAVLDGVREYQQDIIEDVLKDNNKNRAVLLIPSQLSYLIEDLNKRVPLFEESDSNS